MKITSQLLVTITTLLLGMALLFPTAVQFSHVFEGHDHKPCKDLTTHLHEKKIDCSICHFQISSYTYQIQNFKTPFFSEIKITIIDFYTSSDKNKIHYSYALRGPPSYS